MIIIVENKWSVSDGAFLELMKSKKAVIIKDLLIKGKIGVGYKAGAIERERIYTLMKAKARCLKAKKPCADAKKVTVIGKPCGCK